MTYQHSLFRELLALQSPVAYQTKNCPPIGLTITSDISDTSTDPIDGYIEGIDFYVDKGTPFEPNCFENLAFNDSGIWTSVKLFHTFNMYGSLFSDCFTPGCWGTFSHQAVEVTHTNNGTEKHPIDIGFSPLVIGTPTYPTYTPSKDWGIRQAVIGSKTFSIYIILPTRSYNLLNGSTYHSPAIPPPYELLLDLDSFFRTNVDQRDLSDPCALCVFVHIRHIPTQTISPLLTLGTLDSLPILCSFTPPSITDINTWQELGRLAARDFLQYMRSIGSVGLFTNPSTTPYALVDYHSYFTHHFVTNRDNRNAYKDHSNQLQYWAPGAKDIEGNVYLVDIGIFPDCADIPYLIETNIPVGSDGRFYSRHPFPIGKKYIQVRRVSPTTETLVLTYAPSVVSLLRTLNDNNPLTPALEETWGLKDVKVNLEHLSITLLLLAISNYVHTRECEYVYNPPLIDIEVIDLIRKNFITLYNLLAPYQVPYKRADSIPLNLKPVTCKESIYSDAYRNGGFLMGWETGLWEPNCFEGCVFLSPINREVSNRAIGWLCYALSVYRQAINSSEFTGFLIQVSNYLISSLHPVMHLVSNGWTDTNIYGESEEIDEYDMSTSCVCCLALIKSYEQTGMYKYLEAAVDIYQGIVKYLMLPEEGVCADNMTDDTISTETLIYSLWFFTEMGRADIVERLVSLLNTRVHHGLPLTSASLYLSNPVLGEVLYNGMDLVGSIELNPLTYPYSLLNMDVQPYERAQTVTHVIPQLLLLHGLEELLTTENYTSIIDVSNTIQPLEGLRTLVNEELRISSHAALELGKTTFFLNNVSVRIESRHLINTLIGYRNQAFSVVRAGIPIEFGWFHQRALTISGSAGKIIWMLIRGTSSLVVNKNRVHEYRNKERAIGLNFDHIIEDFNQLRRPGEDKHTFLNHYIAYKTRAHNTKQSIINLISLFGLPARLMETPVSIYEQLNTINIHQFESTSLVEQGVMSPFHMVHLVSRIPPSLDFLEAINISTPIGTRINIITHLSFPYPNECAPYLTADFHIVRNHSTLMPSVDLLYLIPDSSNPFNSSCFTSVRVNLSNPYPDQLFVNFNPHVDPSIYISTSPSDYTISVIEPGLSFKVVSIPK